MYLLIHEINAEIAALEAFTFHNVSINSVIADPSAAALIDLHSIMYLLILV